MAHDVINPSKLIASAERLRERASAGASVTHSSGVYTLRWDGDVYRTTNPDGSAGPTWNTRKVTQARRWLINWLNN